MALKDWANPEVGVETPIKNLTIVQLAPGAKTPPHTHAEGYIVVPFLSGSAERVIEEGGRVLSVEPATLEPLVPYYVDATKIGQTTSFRNTSGRVSIFQKFVPGGYVTGPQPELRLEKMKIRTQGGAEHAFVVEVAKTLTEKAIGLMFRPSLASDRGMIFLWPWPMKVAMHMRNVQVPLDMIFIDENYSISQIHQNATPGNLAPIPSNANVKLTLEVPGGTVARIGIAVGDSVD